MAEGLLQGIGNFLGNTYAPNFMQQQRLKSGRQQAQQIIGQPEQQYQMSQAELFPGEQPIEGLKTAGTGLMGGQITPQQAYGQLMTLPGYEQIGSQGLMNLQQQQYGASQAELDRQNAIRLQEMQGQQRMQQLNAQRAAAGQKPFTGEQAKAGVYANRMTAASQLMDELEAQGYTGGIGQQFAGSLTSATGGVFDPTGQGELYQQYQQAQNDWARAKLRNESGAVISQEEIENEVNTYFPQPGDTQEVIEQKRLARKRAEQAMIGQSQGAYQGLFPGTAQGYYQHQQQYSGRTPQEVQRERERQQAQQQAQNQGLTLE